MRRTTERIPAGAEGRKEAGAKRAPGLIDWESGRATARICKGTCWRFECDSRLAKPVSFPVREKGTSRHFPQCANSDGVSFWIESVQVADAAASSGTTDRSTSICPSSPWHKTSWVIPCASSRPNTPNHTTRRNRNARVKEAMVSRRILAIKWRQEKQSRPSAFKEPGFSGR